MRYATYNNKPCKVIANTTRTNENGEVVCTIRRLTCEANELVNDTTCFEKIEVPKNELTSVSTTTLTNNTISKIVAKNDESGKYLIVKFTDGSTKRVCKFVNDNFNMEYETLRLINLYGLSIDNATIRATLMIQKYNELNALLNAQLENED